MNCPVSVLFLAALFTLGSFTPAGHGQDKPRAGFLCVLKKGQLVVVKEVTKK